MAFLSLIENITTSLDDHRHAIYLKKAFDSIDDNIVMKKKPIIALAAL